MSSRHETDRFTAFEPTRLFRTGAVCGFVATVAMGAAITVTDAETLRVAIAGLYGREGSLVAGWLAHLGHGTLFGVLFAAVLTDPGLHDLTEQRAKTTAAGAAYGLVLAVAGAGIIMPIWLEFAGLPGVASIPYVNVSTVTWHLVYGVLLGGLVSTMAGR